MNRLDKLTRLACRVVGQDERCQLLEEIAREGRSEREVVGRVERRVQVLSCQLRVDTVKLTSAILRMFVNVGDTK